MNKKQLQTIGLVLLLPIVFAGVGYFGMKVFLSGSGPQTVEPSEERIVSEIPAQEDSLITGGQEDSKDKDVVKPVDDVKPADDTTGSVTDETSSNDSVEVNDNDADNGVSNAEKTTPEVNNESYKFKSMDVFSLQVGSYSSLSNANKHVESLQTDGLSAYVFSGNNYKVMIGVSESRDGVAELKNSIIDKVPDAFVKGIMVVPDSIVYSDSETTQKEQFDVVITLYMERLQNNLKFISEIKSVDTVQVQTSLNEDIQKNDEILTSISALNEMGSFEMPLAKLTSSLEITQSKLRQYINEENATDKIFGLYIREIMQFNELN